LKKTVALILLLCALFLLFACAKSGVSLDVKDADDVSIYYGVQSYAMFGTDERTLKTLASRVSSLKFQPTDAEMDLPSAFTLTFFKDGALLAQLEVDKNGVYRLKGEKTCYHAVSGDLPYEEIQQIYEDSKTEKKAAGKVDQTLTAA